MRPWETSSSFTHVQRAASVASATARGPTLPTSWFACRRKRRSISGVRESSSVRTRAERAAASSARQSAWCSTGPSVTRPLRAAFT
ncbi:MAG: hypothetical protein QM779_00670 [Propionicimonas sp.]